MLDSSAVLDLLGRPPRKRLHDYCRALGLGPIGTGQRRQLGTGQVMQLLLVNQLAQLGIGPSAAAQIATKVDWNDVILSNGQRLLAARRDAKGWAAIVLRPDQFADLWRVAPHDGLVCLHLGEVCRQVLVADAQHGRVLA